jgi:hypothetical protein
MMLWNLRTRCQASMESLFRGFLQFLSQYFAVIRCNLPPAILRCVMITVFSIILVGTEVAGILRLAKRKSTKKAVFVAGECVHYPRMPV